MHCGRLAVVVGLAIAGCGDNVTGTPFEMFDAAEDAAQCDYFTRCGLFTSRAACDGFFREHPDASLAAAVAAGTVRYNGLAAQQCHAAIATEMSCDLQTRDGRARPEICGRVFFGTLAEGATCMFDGECISGTCDGSANCPVDQCCAGTCAAARGRSVADGPCTTSSDCVAETFCGRDQICHPLAKVGAECSRDGDCDYGLGCIGATDLMPGNCRELFAVGGECPYLRCAEINARCEPSSHRCVAVGLPGAPCNANDECSEFARCDTANHVCVAVPRLGERCEGFCAGEAWCSSLTKTCVAPEENKAPCNADNECASLFCNEGEIFDACEDRPVCF